MAGVIGQLNVARVLRYANQVVTYSVVARIPWSERLDRAVHYGVRAGDREARYLGCRSQFESRIPYLPDVLELECVRRRTAVYGSEIDQVGCTLVVIRCFNANDVTEVQLDSRINTPLNLRP